MWHEARKQERKIRGMLVDYRRRAERRRDFYEKIKADPTQFMQLHGRSYKIHLDPSIAASAESSATMMAWQGQADNLIDRFDARAHLDFITPYVNKEDNQEVSVEERQCNYERYRVLVQNSFLGISEDKFLRQLHLEEQYGYTADIDSSKKKKGTGAAIGFNYDEKDSENQPTPVYKEEEKQESDDSDIEVDVDLSIDVSKIGMSQAHELNRCGRLFGMSGNDFYSYLTNDMEEAENLRAAREEEEERALYSGRRSRRARRAHHEKRLMNRTLSPPSYAAKTSPAPERRSSRSTSKSLSPVNAGEITYITSFGGEDNDNSLKPMTYADKVKAGTSKKTNERKYSRTRSPVRRYRDRSYTRDRKYRSNSDSRSRSRSRSHRRRRSRSRKRSLSNERSRYRKRSRSRSSSVSRKKKNIRRRSTSSKSSVQSNSSSDSRHSSKSKKSSKLSSSSSSYESKSKSRSRSRSLSSKQSPKRMDVDQGPSKPLPRYYGRRKSDKSSSDLEYSSEEENQSQNDMATRPADSKLTGYVSSKSGASFKPGASSVKPQDRLKKKMQILLNKQYKADKKAEQLRNEKLEQEARDRDEQMRELVIKMRRKRRELRQYDDSSQSSKSESDAESQGKEHSVSDHQSPVRQRKSPRRRDSAERSSRSYERSYDRNRDREYDRKDHKEYDRKRSPEDERSSSRAYRDKETSHYSSRHRDSDRYRRDKGSDRREKDLDRWEKDSDRRDKDSERRDKDSERKESERRDKDSDRKDKVSDRRDRDFDSRRDYNNSCKPLVDY